MFKLIVNCFVMLLLSSSLLPKADALDCWLGGSGVSVTIGAASGDVQGTSQACASSGDICKRQTVYQYSSSAPFPISTLSCVVKASDTAANGCSGCTTSPCSYTSTDGLTKTVCSTTTDGNKVLPLKCMVGTFSETTASNTAVSTTCASSEEFCKVDYTTAAAPVGSCAAACVSSATLGCCGADDCNNVLFCYVGSFTAGTAVRTLCGGTKGTTNCKNSWTYNSGVVITGSCADTCVANTVTTSSSAATGNTCCSTSLCNTNTSDSIHKQSMIAFLIVTCGVLISKIFNL